MGDLLGGEGVRFAAAAGVGWGCLEGDEGRGWRRVLGWVGRRVGFVGEVRVDEEGLEVGGVGVGNEVVGAEGEVLEFHRNKEIESVIGCRWSLMCKMKVKDK